MKVLLRCGDGDTGCGEGPDTYECTHTNIASDGREVWDTGLTLQ